MQKSEDRGQRAETETLVCFAMKEEAGPFRKSTAGTGGVAILVTGIGQKNTEMSVREFLQNNSPKRVFTCGIAGALSPNLKLGAVLFESNELQLVKRLEAAGAKPAKIHCADRIASTADEKRKLRDETGADAVEMESETVHRICRERGIPCATVRAISDLADEDLPLDFNVLANPDQTLNYGKLIWAIAKSPGKIQS